MRAERVVVRNYKRFYSFVKCLLCRVLCVLGEVERGVLRGGRSGMPERRHAGSDAVRVHAVERTGLCGARGGTLRPARSFFELSEKLPPPGGRATGAMPVDGGSPGLAEVATQAPALCDGCVPADAASLRSKIAAGPP